MSKQRLLTLLLVLGLVGLIPVAWGATSQVFQAGSGIEITTDSTSDLDISTKATDGGGVNIRARSTGTGVYVDTANKVGIGTASPGVTLDVDGTIRSRATGVLNIFDGTNSQNLITRTAYTSGGYGVMISPGQGLRSAPANRRLT